MGTLRTRPDDTHIPFQNVEELRQLVKISLAQESSHGGSPRIVAGRPAGVSFLGAPHIHGSKLQHPEDVAVEPNAVLYKEDWATALDLDNRRDEQRNRKCRQ